MIPTLTSFCSGRNLTRFNLLFPSILRFYSQFSKTTQTKEGENMADQFDEETATIEEQIEELTAKMDIAAKERDFEELDSLMEQFFSLFRSEEGISAEVEESSPSTFVVSTPIGQFKVDMEEFEAAKTRAKDMVNPPKYSKARQMTREFINKKNKINFKY